MPITNKRFNKDFKKKRIVHSRHIHTERLKKEAKESIDKLKKESKKKQDELSAGKVSMEQLKSQ